ncbi:STY0301 family protein [Zooshikella harenae]|uniref:Uncharacterized protein n=1 Tax=Zooshikella harenae TaxID=2827238 RepID=A0ABS5ZIJ8_9GAMM|nr:STY0301 family protein [Zooshikella harenae]MBU2713902.1 hypothetical protein [Zooshikella harenae]
MVKQLIKLLSTCFLFSASSFAMELKCPDKLSVDQKALIVPKPWRVGHSQFTPKLISINLYDGIPEEMASLAPDNKGTNENFYIWSLDKGNEYWLECNYNHTNITLSMALPKNLTQCKAFYNDIGKPYQFSCQ